MSDLNPIWLGVCYCHTCLRRMVGKSTRICSSELNGVCARSLVLIYVLDPYVCWHVCMACTYVYKYYSYTEQCNSWTDHRGACACLAIVLLRSSFGSTSFRFCYVPDCLAVCSEPMRDGNNPLVGLKGDLKQLNWEEKNTDSANLPSSKPVSRSSINSLSHWKVRSMIQRIFSKSNNNDVCDCIGGIVQPVGRYICAYTITTSTTG